MSTKIEWATETWNPIIGCSKISPGCQNCYAERMAVRLANMNHVAYYQAVTCPGPHQQPNKWNGKTYLVESALNKPFMWKKPRRIFVCSMSDLFHESVPFEWISMVYECVASNPQHTFLFLTKRPERMKSYFDYIQKTFKDAGSQYIQLPNLYLGVTAENQEQANKRIPILLQIPAAKRFVSIEPMLESVTLKQINYLDWVIVGAESGPGRRECHPEWVSNVVDQCKQSSIPVLVKQLYINGKKVSLPKINGKVYDQYPNNIK